MSKQPVTSNALTKFVVKFLDGTSDVVSELNCARASVLAAWLRIQRGASTYKELYVHSVTFYEDGTK